MAPAIATSQTSGWVQPSSIACSANHLQVAAESLPWAHKLRRAVASLLLFPFSKVFLPGLSFSFSISTPLSLFTPCITLLQRLPGPFCKGHLVGKAFVKRLACDPRLKPKSCRHEHMWLVRGWGCNKSLKVQLRCMVKHIKLQTATSTTQPPQEAPAARSNHFAQVGWSVPGAFVPRPLKKCYPSLVKELLCEGCPLAIPFCKGSPLFQRCICVHTYIAEVDLVSHTTNTFFVPTLLQR